MMMRIYSGLRSSVKIPLGGYSIQFQPLAEGVGEKDGGLGRPAVMVIECELDVVLALASRTE